MRRCQVWIGLILLLLTTFAAAAPAASAETSTAELRAKLRSSRKALRAKRVRLQAARVELAAARQLIALYADTPLDDAIEGTGDELSVSDATLVATVPASPEAADVPDEGGPAGDTVVDEVPDPAATADAGGLPANVVDPALSEAVSDADPLPEVVVPTAEQVEALEGRVARLRASARAWRERVEELARRVRRRQRIAAWNRRGEWRPLIAIAARRYGVKATSLYRMMIYESGGRRTAGTTYRGLFQYLPSTWEAGWNPWRGASIYNGWAQIRATAYAIKRGYGPQMWPSTYPRAF